MYYVRKMSFMSYFQHLVVVRKRGGEQRSRRMLLAAALLWKKHLDLFPPARAIECRAYVTC